MLEGGKYEPSVYAHIAVAKFGDHLPLHRQQQIFKRHGIDLPRSTMWEMLDQLERFGVGPILDQAREELLKESYIQADETPIIAMIEDPTAKPKKGKRKRIRKTAYARVYRSGKKVLFQFTLSRSREGPIEFLGPWTGTLQTDGYTGYDEVTRRNGLVRAGCWAHVRRRFIEAMESGSKDAARILFVIRRMYRLEDAIGKRAARDGLDEPDLCDLRQQIRERRTTKLVGRVLALAEEISSKRSTLPKSPLGAALTYLQNQSQQLKVFLADGRVAIDNNAAEQAIRPVALGRKNWLFVGSPRGGEVACQLYSLVNTCKALGINPEAYLDDVLYRIATTPSSQLNSLTPWAWAEEQAGKAQPTSQAAC